jgi:hypothetical protein
VEGLRNRKRFEEEVEEIERRVEKVWNRLKG